MNALEFDCLDDGGYEHVVGLQKRTKERSTTVVASDFDVLGRSR